MIAASEALDLGAVLLDLLVIVVVAKVAAEVAERIRVPAVLGEIVAGILIGPSVFGLIDPSGADTGAMLALLGEIGVLLLLLQVGLEMDLAELGKVGKASLLVAIIGVAIPFAGGALGAWGMGEAGKTAVFLGAALTATSVGITARVLGDLRALSRTESRVVLGAAVADDVLGLVILTVVVKVVTEGSIGAGTVASTIGQAVAFLLVTGVIGVFAVPYVFDRIARHAKATAAVLVAAVALMLAFAELADAAKLAFIIGAFMAGLGIGRSRQSHQIAHDLAPVGHLFIPVFFVGIGINADLEAMAKPSVLGLAAVLTVVGIVGKLVAGWGAVGTDADRLLIGIGMIPRGEVGLIFASIGLARGVLDEDLYGALLIMVLVTTLVSPPLLRWRIHRLDATAQVPVVTPEPEGGWLTVDEGRVELQGTPPPDLTVALGLDAARLVATGARPGDALLRWFDANRSAELTWSRTDTDELLALLRHGDHRSWRLLEITGVLERALPEVHDSLERHRSDPGELDVLRGLTFPTVERIQVLLDDTEGLDTTAEPDGDDDTSVLLVAAMVVDVGDSPDGGHLQSLVQRLHVGSRGAREEVLAVVAGAHALEATASRAFAGIEPATIDGLVDQMDDARTARLASVLARALVDSDASHRARLDELITHVRARLLPDPT